MKNLKETSPSLAMEIDNQIYYAATATENYSKVKFEYNGQKYSIFNHDEIEYELIHWLSGNDALDNGYWRDRVATGGAMDFDNHGCVWNDARDGYYSADGEKQFFQTRLIPTLDFGTDWYVEIIAQIGAPLGTQCFFIDLGALGNSRQGEGLSIMGDRADSKYSPGRIGTNTKPNGDVSGFSADTDNVTYTWDELAIFTFGVKRYSTNQSRSFITWNGNRYYGNPFDTVQWNRWGYYFYLFRGWASTWTNRDGFYNIYQCGPTTIYDVKVWRKK